MPPPAPAARRRAVVVLALSLLCGLGAAWYGRGLETDNQVESWAEATGPDPGYDVLLERFGGDFLVLARFTGVDPASAAHDAFLRGLGERLGGLPGAGEVLDAFHLPGAPPASLAEALRSLEERPLARATDLGGAHPPRFDAYVVIDESAGPAEALAFDDGFRALRAEARAIGLSVAAAGHPFMSAALDRESRVVDRVYAPLLVLAGLLVCAALLRSLPLGLVALLPGVFGALAVRAGLRVAGVPSNMILVAAGPLVFVVMVASMVHLVSAWRREAAAGVPPAEAARRARRATLRPALIAAATTAAGFGVFVTSEVSAVRELGGTVALAVALLVPASYLLLPVVLAGLAVRPRPRAGAHPARRVAMAAARTRALWLVLTGALLAAGAFAPRGMPVAISAVDYFADGHPIREEYLQLEENSPGLSSLDVLVRATGGAADLDEGRGLGAALAALPDVGAVFGPPDVLDEVARLGPTALALAPAAMRELGRLGSEGQWLRWSARAAVASPEEVERFSAGVRGVAASWGAEHGREVLVAGSLQRLAAMQQALVGTLARSLSLTALVALLSFVIVLRGARQVGVAIVANLIPVAAVLAGARLLGYALDAATCMVASAVVGLALDNTFHILLAAGDGGDSGLRARIRAFDRVGEAAVAGILVLTAGFICLAAADFQPTARFGALAALGLLGALFADLALIPALWFVRPRRAPA